MIVETIVSLLVDLLVAILEPLLLLIPQPPGDMLVAWGYLHDMWALIQSFDTWIPVSFVFGAAGVMLVLYAVSLSIGIGRTVLSYFTFGGGAR